LFWNKIDNIGLYYPVISKNHGKVSLTKARGGTQKQIQSISSEPASFQKATYEEEFVMRTQKARFVFLFVLLLALVAFPTSVSAKHTWGKYQALTIKDVERYYQGDLTLGNTVTGSLTLGEPVHYWGFGGTAGDTVFVNLASSDGGDTYLKIYVANGSNWDLIAEADECQGTLNSCLDLTLPQTGRYLVGATTYRYVSSGRKTAMNYNLTVYCTSASGVCGAVAVAEGGIWGAASPTRAFVTK
jgi:hypothetical protein